MGMSYGGFAARGPSWHVKLTVPFISPSHWGWLYVIVGFDGANLFIVVLNQLINMVARVSAQIQIII